MKFDNDKPRLTISKPELEALVSAASDEDARINISVIRIEPAARTVAATNGHWLLLGTEMGSKRVDKGAVYTTEPCSLPPAPGDAISIARKHVQQWLRFATKSGEIAITWAGPKVSAEIDGQTLTVEHTNTTFPPWRLVIPEAPSANAKPPPMIGLGARLVGNAVEAMLKVSEHERDTCVAWHFNGNPLDENRGPECHPVVLCVTGHDSQWRALVMPMRYINEDRIDPWRTAFPEPKKKDATPAKSEAKEQLSAIERTRSQRKKAAKKPAAKKTAKRGRR